MPHSGLSAEAVWVAAVIVVFGVVPWLWHHARALWAWLGEWAREQEYRER